MPLDTSSIAGSFGTGSVAGYVGTLEKARQEEGDRRKGDLETLRALLNAGWKPLDPKKGSPTGEALVLPNLGQVMIPPLIDKEAEFKLRMRELTSREKLTETQLRIAQINERVSELDRLTKESTNASAERRADIAERVAEINKESSETGLKSTKLSLKIKEAQLAIIKAQAATGTVEGKVTKPITITDKDGKQKTIMAIVDEKNNTWTPVTSKTGEVALAPVTAKEATPITEMDEFRQRSTLASAKNAVETKKTTKEAVAGQANMINTDSPEPYMYRWTIVSWGNDKWMAYKLPKTKSGVQLTAKSLSTIARKYGMTVEDFLDKSYKAGELDPTTWPLHGWKGEEVKEKEIGTVISGPPAPQMPVNYGRRTNNTLKGNGFLGPRKMLDGSGRVASELSITVEFDGQEVLIPTMIPTLTQDELNLLLKGKKPTDPIVQKAIEFYKKRRAQGLGAFAQPGEEAR